MSDILHSGPRSITSPMLFAALSPQLQQRLITTSPARPYRVGQIIQQRGERANGFYLIETGSVAVGRYLESGDFRGVAVLGPGDSWGELAMFAERVRVVDAVARSSCAVRFVRQSDFDAALGENPYEYRAMLGVLSAQLQDTLDIMAGIRRGTAHTRVAGLLATLAGSSGQTARIEITQQELGELLGLTRMTVSGALKELETSGAITRRYGHIEIRSLEAVRLAALG